MFAIAIVRLSCYDNSVTRVFIKYLCGGVSMGWRLQVNFSDGSSELEDEVFDSEEAAEEEYEVWLDSYHAGQETLRLAGEDYDDASIVDCDIWEE